MRAHLCCLAIALVATLGACSNDPCTGGGVCLSVRVEGVATGLEQLVFMLSGESKSAPATPRSFSLPVLVAIYPPAALADGQAHELDVTGLDAAMSVVGAASKDVVIPKSGEASVTLTLGAFAPGDSGFPMDGGGDGSVNSDMCAPSACGPSDVAMTTLGCGSVDCGPPSVFAVSPAVAATGQVIAIEGRFGAGTTATVHFPGGDASATSVTPTHLLVTVPFQATAGNLNVTVGGQTSGSVSFRRMSFAAGAMQFRREYEQGTYARTLPTQLDGRRDAGSATLGSFLWVLGGSDGAAVNTVERAMINADGTIGGFVAQTNTLTTPRTGGAAVVLGGRIYVVGGGTGSAPIKSVEYATIQADHTISAFADAGVSLLGGHDVAAAQIVGRWLYLFSGGADASIERAPIAADGTLGAFVAAGTLPSTLTGAATLVSGGYVYLIGGIDSSGYSTAVQRAPIMGDGSLGAFAATGAGVTLAHGRSLHRVVQVRDVLLAIGGQDASGPLASIETSTIGADGTPGAFTASSKTLQVAREAAVIAVVGNTIHIIGGQGATMLSTSEVAQLNTSGAIGSFAAVAGVTFVNGGQFNAAAAVIGSYVYILGGHYDDGSGHALTMRAPVNPDGTLGTFVNAAADLDIIREWPSVSVTGNRVYVLGGTTTGVGGAQNSYVYATINDDATLSAFSSSAGTSMGGTAHTDMPSVMIVARYFGLGGYTGTAQLSSMLYSNFGGYEVFGNPSGYGGPTIGVVRDKHRSFVLDPNVYVAGGSSTDTPSSESIYAGAIAFGTSDIGTFAIQTPTLTKLRYEAGIAIIGPTLYVLGGYGATSASETDYDYSTIADNGSIGTLTESAAGTLGAGGRSNAPALVLGNYIYMFGGVSGTTPSNTVIGAPLN